MKRLVSNGVNLHAVSSSTHAAIALFFLFTLTFLVSLTALAAPADHFVTTWQTDNPGTSNASSVMVPMMGGPYDVDWNNDGVFDEFGLYDTAIHDYGVAGVYTIRIQGAYDAIRFSNDDDKEKIISLDQWGTQSWTSMLNAFYGASNLLVPATDTPDFSSVTSMWRAFDNAILANPDTSGWDTSAVTNMFSMFYRAASANPDTSDWDTSAVTNMDSMFNRATSANPDTSGWDTSSVTTMGAMFWGAISANPDTSDWDTSAVTYMSSMFQGATSANPDTSGWDTSAVTDMSFMFARAALAKPDTSGWDTSAVTTMSRMFWRATSANPDTSGWDTSAVTNMGRLFSTASSANPDTSGWDTQAVTNMYSMFFNADSANPNTSGWDTSAVTDMSWMFAHTPINPNTSGWDTSAVMTMQGMFNDTASANPDISGWDTSAVVDMSWMFSRANSFDRDIGSWNVTVLADATDMFNEAALSTANYDSLLNGWNAQALQPGVMFNGGNSTYCLASAVAARANMTTSDTWVITDGGQQECPPLVRPINIRATDGKFYDRVRVTFDLVAGATIYRVFRCPDRGDTCGNPIGFAKKGSFDDRKSVPGVVNFYRVKACNLNNCGPLSWANSGFIKKQPPAPTAVRATDGSFTDRVRVTFNPVNGVTVYRVYRCTGSVDTCGRPVGFPKSGTFDDKKGVPGTVYSYRVKACTPSTCSDFSTANTGFSKIAPARPTAVVATDGAFNDRVRVTFNPVATATVYRVFRCMDKGDTCGLPIGYPKTGTYADRKGVSGTVYFYRVKACTATVCGKISFANSGYRGSLPSMHSDAQMGSLMRSHDVPIPILSDVGRLMLILMMLCSGLILVRQMGAKRIYTTVHDCGIAEGNLSGSS